MGLGFRGLGLRVLRDWDVQDTEALELAAFFGVEGLGIWGPGSQSFGNSGTWGFEVWCADKATVYMYVCVCVLIACFLCVHLFIGFCGHTHNPHDPQTP